MVIKSEVSSGYPFLCEGPKNDDFHNISGVIQKVSGMIADMSRVTSDD